MKIQRGVVKLPLTGSLWCVELRFNVVEAFPPGSLPQPIHGSDWSSYISRGVTGITYF